MTVRSGIDLPLVLGDQLARARPDLLCKMLQKLHPEWVSLRNGCRHRDFDTRAGTGRRRDPQAAARVVLPGVAAGARQAGRAGAHQRGGDLLPARRLDPEDGQARAEPGHHQPVQVPGRRDLPKELDAHVEEFPDAPTTRALSNS